MKCLIVDDDRDDQELFMVAMKELNSEISVSTADNGVQAMELLLQKKLPNFIVLDLNMPIMCGRQFLKKIKSIPRLKDIPVFVFTTSNAERDRSDALELGATAFITKPYTFSSLISLIDRLILRRV